MLRHRTVVAVVSKGGGCAEVREERSGGRLAVERRRASITKSYRVEVGKGVFAGCVVRLGGLGEVEGLRKASMEKRDVLGTSRARLLVVLICTFTSRRCSLISNYLSCFNIYLDILDFMKTQEMR